MTESLGNPVEKDPLQGKNVPQYFRLIEDAMRLGSLDKEEALRSGNVYEMFDVRVKSLMDTYKKNPAETRQLAVNYVTVLDEIIRLSGQEGRAVATYYGLNQPGLEDFAGYSEVIKTLSISEKAPKLRISRIIEKGMRKINFQIHHNMEKFIPEL